MIYMDYNATAPVLPGARDAIIDALDLIGNPSSVHKLGRAAHRLVEDSRAAVLALVGAPEGSRIIFTSGGTEANSLSLLGSGRERIIASAIEHPAVRSVKEKVEFIAVNNGGVIDLSALEAALEIAPGADASDTIVSVMLANNETGVIQPLKQIVEIAHKAGALVHSDVVQAAGKIEIDFANLGVDYVTISAHKFGGPKGVGALITKPGAPLKALVSGGGQEKGLRGGTENVSGIAGMAAAAIASLDALKDEANRLLSLRDNLEKQIKEIEPAAHVIGAGSERLPNTSFIVMPGVLAETQVAGFDLAGICVSAGSACASGKIKQSPVLAAMNVAENDGASGIRVSLGHDNSQDHVNRFVSVWNEIRTRAINANAA